MSQYKDDKVQWNGHNLISQVQMGHVNPWKVKFSIQWMTWGKKLGTEQASPSAATSANSSRLCLSISISAQCMRHSCASMYYGPFFRVYKLHKLNHISLAWPACQLGFDRRSLSLPQMTRVGHSLLSHFI